MDQSEPFDDELLSAYLDDELAADERARVEAHLQADPAARKLLEQLEHVAQSVRTLPEERLGGDLRVSVLRRAERAMLVAPAQDETGGDRPLRRLDGPAGISIGRSRRGWFWAGLTVAAALLVMFVQQRQHDEAGLPREVAQHSAPAAKPGPTADRPPEQRLALDQAEPAALDRQPTPQAADDLDRSKVIPPASFSHSHTSETDEPSQLSPREATDRNNVLLVRLHVRPAALRSKVFDKTLLRHSIAIESPEASAGSGHAASSPPGEDNLEVVLVEAEPTQLAACLEELTADGENFVEIEVEQPLAATVGVSPRAARPASGTGLDWSRYGRGRALPRSSPAADDRSGSGRRRGPAAAASDDAPRVSAFGAETRPLHRGKQQQAQQQQPARLSSSDATGERATEADARSQGRQSSSAVQQGVARRGVVAWPKDRPGRLQALFVLQPADEAPATPPSTAAP